MINAKPVNLTEPEIHSIILHWRPPLKQSFSILIINVCPNLAYIQIKLISRRQELRECVCVPYADAVKMLDRRRVRLIFACVFFYKYFVKSVALTLLYDDHNVSIHMHEKIFGK